MTKGLAPKVPGAGKEKAHHDSRVVLLTLVSSAKDPPQKCSISGMDRVLQNYRASRPLSPRARRGGCVVVHLPSFILEDDMRDTFRGLMEVRAGASWNS